LRPRSDLWPRPGLGVGRAESLYRFFGRNAFGGLVGITVHHFGDAAADAIQREWQEWIDGLFA
jgi:hypothetical protein